MKKEDFTKDELKLLKAIFKGAEEITYIMRDDRYDTYLINALYEIKQKLGIYDILEEAS